MKLLVEDSGLGLSNFPCTLCEANKSEIRDPENIRQGFPISRTYESLHQAGHLARLNPNKLSRAQLGEKLKGSKAIPLTLGNASMVNNAFEALHFKLSIARWLVKIIGRVNAKIFVWAIDQSLKPSFQPFEDHLLNQMTKVLGIQRRLQIQVCYSQVPHPDGCIPRLMNLTRSVTGAPILIFIYLQGNEASKLLSPDNVQDVLSLVTNQDQRENMRFLISELVYMNLVIQVNF